MSHRIGQVAHPHRWLATAGLTVPLAAAGLFAVPVGVTAGAGAATPAFTKMLTNASNGTTTVVPKGTQIEVKLASDGFRWTEAAVINAGPEAVLKFESGHVNPNGSSVTTFLVVVYNGEATLQATGVKKCSDSPACTPVVKTWRANVVAYV